MKEYSCFVPQRETDLWIRSSGGILLYSDEEVSLEKYELDEVSASIWDKCDGRNSIRGIAALIMQECGGQDLFFDEILQDVYEVCTFLHKERLISWLNPDCINVLLVSPPPPMSYSDEAIKTEEFSAPPLGLCYIASVLRKNDYSVKIYDMHLLMETPETIVQQCRRFHPQIIGITATTPSFTNAARISRYIKAYDEQIVTIVGGPHATGDPEGCLKEDSVDYICIGEGEETMLEFTDMILRENETPNDINGIAFKIDDRVVFTKHRDRIKDLDILPFPARDLIDIDQYSQKGSIVSSRGCPIGCNFCSCAVISGNTCRPHSVDYVLNEIEYMINELGYKYFDFHDDTFNLFKNRVYEFCNKIKNRKLEVEWGCFCRAAQMTKDMAVAMVDAGCTVIQFGVESGNDDILKSINKNTNVKQIKDAVSYASDAGVKQITCGFIIGHADDTEETVMDTINLGLELSRLGATRLTLSLITPYPGTKIYDYRDELGIELLTDNWEKYTFSKVVAQTKNLTENKLRELYVEGLIKFLEVSEY